MKQMLSARLRSFAYAGQGIRWLIVSQPNARIHLVAMAVVIGAGIVFDISAVEWAVLSLTIGMVIAMEAMNSAVEALADALHPEHNELIGRAKDVAAGGVLIAAIAAVGVAAAVFIPYL